MNVLGLETSCDETGLAIYNDKNGIIAQVLYSQIELHALYGGVVPELASRDHIKKLLPLLNDLLAQSGLTKSDIHAIAFTKGPGLIGALMTGALFARSLAFALNIPAIGVHHMEGHLLSPLITDDSIQFPFVCLLVSGGHTMLVRADGVGDYQVLGESIDDAAGECFDKCAKMLGLPYPGGALVSQLAATGNSAAFALPRPMLHKGLNFSFSGMKTAVHNVIKNYLTDDLDAKTRKQITADICASFELAMVDVLAYKCQKALLKTGLERLVIAGGVSANTRLRQTLSDNLASIGACVHYALPSLCTDNGAMIAYAGFLRLQAGQCDDLAVSCVPRWDIASLTAI